MCLGIYYMTSESYMIFELARKLFRLPSLNVSREQALRIAEAECERRGFLEEGQGFLGQLKNPIIHEGIGKWEVITRIQGKGCPRMLICKRTGAVLKFVFLPR
jgi:hypothetical protein